MSEPAIPKWLFGLDHTPPDGGSFWLLHTERPRFVASVVSFAGDSPAVSSLQFNIHLELDRLDHWSHEDIAAIVEDGAKMLAAKSEPSGSAPTLGWTTGLSSHELPRIVLFTNADTLFASLLFTRFPFVLIAFQPGAQHFTPLELTCDHPLTEDKTAQLMLEAQAFYRELTGANQPKES